MKIYTKTGDKGETGLYSGKRLRKDDIKIEAYGTVDELNSQLGALENIIEPIYNQEYLDPIQNILFVIGSHLATEADSDLKLPEIKEQSITELEKGIDQMELELEPLKTFILPGGSLAISQAHIARTVCRRAERRAVSLSYEEELHPLIIPYLNRLSDFLFVMSRFIALKEGVKEKPWLP